MDEGRDRAVSEAVGTVLMVAMVVVLAGVVYLWVGGSHQQAPPPAMALSGDTGATSTDRSFTVSAVSTPLRWSDVSVKLDDADMTYDSSLSSPATYCVVTSGSTCAPTNSWVPEATRVAAGSRIMVHDSALPGKTLLVTVPEENAAILQVHLG